MKALRSNIKKGDLVKLPDGKEIASVKSTEVLLGNKIVEGGLYLDKPLDGLRYWNEDSVIKVENKSHLTAIARKGLPGPTKWLIMHGKLNGHYILDYGCGKCHEINNQNLSMDGYDPTFRPDGIVYKKYDYIICNYVLCVLPSLEERTAVLEKIKSLLSRTGVAYISVRNDTPKKGHGWTSRGTFQGKVELDLPIVHTDRLFKIYKLTH